MTPTIKFVVEPTVLLLAWQAPDHMGNRRRWMVAKIDVTNDTWSLRYLRGAEFKESNGGKSFEDLLALGYQGYPAFAFSVERHDLDVRSALMRRLPPRNRPDFKAFVAQFGFREDRPISDAALLSYTSGKLPSDGFSIAAELRSDLTTGDLIFEVAGARHQMPPECRPEIGDPLAFKDEPENEHDPHAIAVFCRDCRIGYINRLQVQVFGHWLKSRSVDATVQRVNGRPGEPRIYAIVQVRSSYGSAAA